jgi:phosphonate transport system substrate-binding protein
MVINKKKYKGTFIALFHPLLRPATGPSARGTAHTKNGFLIHFALFIREIGLIAATMALCAMLAPACSKEQTTSSAPGHIDQTLVIGLVPEQSLFKQVRRFEPIANYLSHRLQINVRLTVLPSYEKALGSFSDKKIDAAFLGSFIYVLAHSRLGVEALARPVDPDGTSSYFGVIFARTDSNIRSVRELRGKRFAFVDKDTMAGHLLPLAYFRKWGVEYTTYLREFYFAGTHEDVIYDVLERKADAGAAKSTVFKRLMAEDVRVGRELVVLARTPEVPENSLAVRRDLDAHLKDRIKTALLDMHKDPEGARALKDFNALKFIETTDKDFKSVYTFAQELGIDVHSGNDAPAR